MKNDYSTFVSYYLSTLPNESCKVIFRVTFLRISEDGSTEFLGNVQVDDSGTSRHLTLLAKAFRVCAPVCLNANKTITEKL